MKKRLYTLVAVFLVAAMLLPTSALAQQAPPVDDSVVESTPEADIDMGEPMEPIVDAEQAVVPAEEETDPDEQDAALAEEAAALDEGEAASAEGAATPAEGATVADDPDMSSAANARPLTFGQAYSGVLNKAISYNWYTFTLDTPGVVTVKFQQDYKGGVDGVFLYLSKGTEAINSTINIVNKLYMRAHTQSVEWTPIGLGAGTYYFYLKPDNGSMLNMGGLTFPYTIQIDHTAALDWEQEPNNTLAEATAAALDKTMHGSTMWSEAKQSAGDNDYFVFDVPVAGNYTFKFATPDYQWNFGWTVKLLGAQGNILKEFPTLHISAEDSVELALSAGKHYLNFNMRGVHAHRYSFLIQKAADPVDPGTPDPGTPDPGTPDPGTPDPGTSDPGTPDPGPGIVDPGAPDTDKVAADKAALSKESITASSGTGKMTLPTTGANGSAIVWASDNAAVIDPATGAITRPAAGA
ncbi:MAG: hypothetical protein GXY32_06840, partial [Ruminococcaceae bacterium]|nr:hypothetical protein [Oscillospiraceae bacterium]